tara:strand:+ start:381 stop:620 length:240 start_codon:yes stop_codon:yes gene_type:complete
VVAVVEVIQVLQEELAVQVEAVQELVTLMQHQEQPTLAVVAVELVDLLLAQQDQVELVDLVWLLLKNHLHPLRPLEFGI